MVIFCKLHLWIVKPKVCPTYLPGKRIAIYSANFQVYYTSNLHNEITYTPHPLLHTLTTHYSYLLASHIFIVYLCNYIYSPHYWEGPSSILALCGSKIQTNLFLSTNLYTKVLCCHGNQMYRKAVGGRTSRRRNEVSSSLSFPSAMFVFLLPENLFTKATLHFCMGV